MARSMKLACVVLVMCMVVIAPMAEGDISCADVIKEFSSCLTYLEAPDNASPSGQCCGGVKKLLDAATTTADRQAACECLKSAAASIGSFNANNAVALPGKCGVSIPYKVPTSTSCYNIKF